MFSQQASYRNGSVPNHSESFTGVRIDMFDPVGRHLEKRIWMEVDGNTAKPV